MRIGILTLTCLVAIADTLPANAQTAPDVQSSIASPDGAAMMKSVQSSMNYYDGTMNIQIPLYTLSEFGLSVPIQLRYKTSGIKVEDTASSVGLGWEVSAGGKITRIVQGKPDETETYGYCNNINHTPDNMFRKIFRHPQSSQRWQYNKEVDTAPDLFYYEIPGASGMFVCDHTGKVHTIPYQHIDIQWVDKTYFEITEPSGNRYILGETETSREVSLMQQPEVEDIRYTSTWLLDRAEDQFGNKISFSYQIGTSYTIKNMRESYTFSTGAGYSRKTPEQLNYKSKDRSTSLTLETPKYLYQIKGKNRTISFSLGMQYSNASPMYYKGFDVLESGWSAGIRFRYSWFNNNALKLIGVDRTSGSEYEKIADFQYYKKHNLPARNSKDFDNWGYYNGRGNTTLFPHFENYGEGYGLWIEDGAKHDPDLEYAQANTLNRIDFGTGGYEEYKYESNEIYDYKYLKYETVGGLRIKEIIRSDGKNTYTTFLEYIPQFDAFPKVSGVRIGSAPAYFLHSLGLGTVSYWTSSHKMNNDLIFQSNSVEYYEVKEILPNGSYNIYEYHTGREPNHEDEYCTLYYWDSNTQGLKTENTSIKRIFNTTRFWRRGLLYRSSHYDSQNSLISRTQNHYSFGAPKEPSTIHGFIPEYNESNSALYGYKWYSEPVYLDKTVTEAGPYNTPSTVEYKYDTVYMVAKEIKETDGLGNTTIKRTSYSFDYQIDSDPMWPFPTSHPLLVLQSKKMIAPVETTVLKNGRVVQSEYMTYKFWRVPASADKASTLVVMPSMKWGLPLTTSLAANSFSPVTVQNGSDLVKDSKYKLQLFFDWYNSDGQLMGSHTPDGRYQSTLYGYSGTLPIAQIDNAVASPESPVHLPDNQAFHTSFEEEPDAISDPTSAKTGKKVFYGPYSIDLQNLDRGSYLLTYWQRTGRTGTWTPVEQTIEVGYDPTTHTIGGSYYIDEIRIIPYDARMTTYTYFPGIGKTSETDTNGMTTYYEYDRFGRLIRISDNNRNPLKAYSYQIKQ